MTNRPIEANVTVAGVPVKGMTKQEATDAISEAFLLSQRGKQMVVKLGDETITLTSDVTKVQLDTANLVDAISKVTAQYPQQEVFPIAEYVQMDKEAVMSILQAVTDKLQSTLVQSSYVVEGKAPEALDKADETVQQKITFTMGTPGISINPERVYEAIAAAYAEGNFAFEFVFPIEKPDVLDLEAIFAENCIAPVDAVMDSESYVVTA
jgi:hypothetical protein